MSDLNECNYNEVIGIANFEYNADSVSNVTYPPDNETDFNNDNDIMNNNHNQFDLNNQTNENMNISVHKESSINFDILRVSISHRKCCICQKESYNKNRNKRNIKLQLVSHFALRDAFKKTKILIPYGARCCKSHFKNDLIDEDALKLLVPFSKSYRLNENNIGSFQTFFDGLVDDPINNDFFHKFRNCNQLNEASCVQNTVYNVSEFLTIHESIVTNDELKMHETSNRSVCSSLFVLVENLK